MRNTQIRLVPSLDYLCDNNYKDNVAIVMGNGDYNWTLIVAGASYNIDNKYNKMKISFITKNLGKVYLHSDKGLDLGVVENNSILLLNL